MDVTLSVEFLAGLTGMQPGDLSEALKNGEGDELKSSEEIQTFLSTTIEDKFKKTRKAGYDEGHGRGTRESLTNLEKELATEWGIEYEKGMTVKDLAQAHLEKNQKGSKSEKLTPEAIKASDVYRNDLKAEMDKRTALETEFNTFKTTAEREKVFGVVKSKAMDFLTTNNFILPENAKIRENAINGFLSDLTKDIDFELNEGTIAGMKRGGVPVEDTMMNPIKFEDHVLNTGKAWFEVKKGDGRSSPGAHSQPGGSGGGGKFPIVKSSEEFYQHFHSLETLEDKTAFKEAYDKQLKEGF